MGGGLTIKTDAYGQHSLTHTPTHTHMYIQCIYRERRQALYELLGPVVEPGHFDFATHVETGQVG